MKRRLCLAALSGALGALAQQPGPLVRKKGPTVFLDYDQAELDAAYDQRVYAPNSGVIQQRYATNSELVRARLGAPLRVPYGPSETDPAKSGS